MTDTTLGHALAYARRGWPVFPCLPGQKIPATTHGFHDATTDEQQITAWFTRHPGRNLAIATGAPGPNVLHVDQHGPDGSGFPAYARLRRAGLLTNAPPPTPNSSAGGSDADFTVATRNGHLPDCHLDFRWPCGYILARPSHVGGHPYQLLKTTGAHGTLDRDAVTRSCNPIGSSTPPAPPGPRPGPRPRPLGRKPTPGNLNAGRSWAANRVLETDPAADLSPLAAAARHAGRTTRRPPGPRLRPPNRPARPDPPDHQAEAGN